MTFKEELLNRIEAAKQREMLIEGTANNYILGEIKAALLEGVEKDPHVTMFSVVVNSFFDDYDRKYKYKYKEGYGLNKKEKTEILKWLRDEFIKFGFNAEIKIDNVREYWLIIDIN